MSNSFVFYESFAEALQDLPGDAFKECVMALCSYVFKDKDPNTDSLMTKMFFSMARPLLDSNIAKKENGSKGGRPKKTTPERVKQEEKPMVTEKKPMVIKSETIGFETENHRFPMSKPDVDVDVDVDVDGDVDGDVEKVRECKASPGVVSVLSDSDAESLGIDPVVSGAVSAWIENRDAKGEPLSEAELKSFVSVIKAKTKEHGPQAVADLIGESMSNGYKGVIWDRLDRNRGKPKNAYIDRIDHRMDVVDEWARSVGAYEEGS